MRTTCWREYPGVAIQVSSEGLLVLLGWWVCLSLTDIDAESKHTPGQP